MEIWNSLAALALKYDGLAHVLASILTEPVKFCKRRAGVRRRKPKPKHDATPTVNNRQSNEEKQFFSMSFLLIQMTFSNSGISMIRINTPATGRDGITPERRIQMSVFIKLIYTVQRAAFVKPQLAHWKQKTIASNVSFSCYFILIYLFYFPQLHRTLLGPKFPTDTLGFETLYTPNK